MLHDIIVVVYSCVGRTAHSAPEQFVAVYVLVACTGGGRIVFIHHIRAVPDEIRVFRHTALCHQLGSAQSVRQIGIGRGGIIILIVYLAVVRVIGICYFRSQKKKYQLRGDPFEYETRRGKTSLTSSAVFLFFKPLERYWYCKMRTLWHRFAKIVF